MGQTKQRAPMELVRHRLRHPERRAVLAATVEAAEPISPKKLSDRLGHSLSTMAYHVRVLAECEALLMVDAKPVRGSTEHFYVSALTPAEARRELEQAEREAAKRNAGNGGGSDGTAAK